MAKKKPASPPTFEESLDQLEAIVRKLEGGQLPLADSLEQYELGIRHLGLCYKMLARVEKKVEILSGLDAQGNPLAEPFDDFEDEPKDASDTPPTPQKGPSTAKNRAARGRRRSSPPRNNPPANSSPSNVNEGGTHEGGTLF